MGKPIYLDYQATTPVDPRVVDAMLPYFTEVFGNPASGMHMYGNEADQAVSNSRDTIAKAIKAKGREIIFTSGATEAINLAIKGVANAYEKKGNHFITVCTEHKAVLDSHQYLESVGKNVTYLPVRLDGLLDLNQVADSIQPDTVMVSVMAVNNEIGVIQDIEAIGKICEEKSVIFFTDATQGLGKIPLDVRKMNIHLLAASAHKIYGPKGVGCLYVRSSNPRIKTGMQMHGGGHERGMRSGTLNVPGIVGFAEAASIAQQEMKSENKRLLKLRNEFLSVLEQQLDDVKLNASLKQRIPGNLNLQLGVESEAMMVALQDEVAISTGSACTSTDITPSHVLKALGLSDEEVFRSVRIGLGRFSKTEDVRQAGETILGMVLRLRAAYQPKLG